jgi:hypothetical protein
MKQKEIDEINKIRGVIRSPKLSRSDIEREEAERVNKIKAASKFTESFFKWAEENGFSSQDIADELGASRVVVSNWRSKGLPRIHNYACRAYMDKVKREKITRREEG